MRVERSTVDQVKARLEKLKRKAENPEPEKEYGTRKLFISIKLVTFLD